MRIARRRSTLLGNLELVVCSLFFYGFGVMGADIFGSYRFEPSGVQYAFLLPLGVLCGLTAVGCYFTARATDASAAMWIFPFVAGGLMAITAVGLPLTDANLERCRITVFVLMAAHLAFLVIHLLRSTIRHVSTQRRTP